MSTELGRYGKGGDWATLTDTATPLDTGHVRVTTHIVYGQGTAYRYTDLTIEEAERYGVELIQAAQQAAEAKAARDIKVRAEVDAAIRAAASA